MPSKKKKYNARFPPARIKKIMQTDDDVGKVAAAVPVIISRALELFIESLITRTSETTRARSAKTLSTQHIKHTILGDCKFDFLKDLVANIPDVAQEEEEGASSSFSSNPDTEGAPKRRGRPRKIKTEDGEAPAPKRGRKRKPSSEDSEATEDAETESEGENASEESMDVPAATTSSAPSAALGAPPASRVKSPSTILEALGVGHAGAPHSLGGPPAGSPHSLAGQPAGSPHSLAGPSAGSPHSLGGPPCGPLADVSQSPPMGVLAQDPALVKASSSYQPFSVPSNQHTAGATPGYVSQAMPASYRHPFPAALAESQMARESRKRNSSELSSSFGQHETSPMNRPEGSSAIPSDRSPAFSQREQSVSPNHSQHSVSSTDSMSRAMPLPGVREGSPLSRQPGLIPLSYPSERQDVPRLLEASNPGPVRDQKPDVKGEALRVPPVPHPGLGGGDGHSVPKGPPSALPGEVQPGLIPIFSKGLKDEVKSEHTVSVIVPHPGLREDTVPRVSHKPHAGLDREGQPGLIPVSHPAIHSEVPRMPQSSPAGPRGDAPGAHKVPGPGCDAAREPPEGPTEMKEGSPEEPRAALALHHPGLMGGHMPLPHPGMYMGGRPGFYPPYMFPHPGSGMPGMPPTTMPYPGISNIPGMSIPAAVTMATGMLPEHSAPGSQPLVGNSMSPSPHWTSSGGPNMNHMNMSNIRDPGASRAYPASHSMPQIPTHHSSQPK